VHLHIVWPVLTLRIGTASNRSRVYGYLAPVRRRSAGSVSATTLPATPRPCRTRSAQRRGCRKCGTGERARGRQGPSTASRRSDGAASPGVLGMSVPPGGLGTRLPDPRSTQPHRRAPPRQVA
jgi:hypothetical protein